MGERERKGSEIKRDGREGKGWTMNEEGWERRKEKDHSYIKMARITIRAAREYNIVP